MSYLLKDLQQLYTGELVFPSIEYTGSSPNAVDYSVISRDQQRFYYTALNDESHNVGSGFSKGILIVSGNISKQDFPLANAGMNFDQGHINIQLRAPGPINSSPFNVTPNVGTGYGSTTGGTPAVNIQNSGVEGFKHHVGFDNSITDESVGRIAFRFNFYKANIDSSQGILLVKVSMSGSIHPTGSIKQITIRRTDAGFGF